jgi:hypothetical protein
VGVLKYEWGEKEKGRGEFSKARNEFQKWGLLFQRIGLKPRRFLMDTEGIYIGTSTGWFRLGFRKYGRQELQWLQRMLEHLEERAFKNWAVPWSKTIVYWGENNDGYLIQPWVMTGEYFQAADPGSVQRLAEIMADFYRAGKDYRTIKGVEVIRDRWSNIESEWESNLRGLDNLKAGDLPEKARSDVNELRKSVIQILKESLAGWCNSGMHSLYEHQWQTGILGHGRLLARHIVWLANDYYLLNWESLAFQPRILDLALLIRDVAYWEPDWIHYMINEFSRVQPFWPEEYSALFAVLRYPQEALLTLEAMDSGEPDRKLIKAAIKELVRKERCLEKVWRELGTEKRWAGSFIDNSSQPGFNKISMALSPLETWGDFQGVPDTIISVQNEPRLPAEVMERLSDFDRDRIVGGKDGNILQGAAVPDPEKWVAEPEIQIPPPSESVIMPEMEEPKLNQVPVENGFQTPKTKEPETVIRWAGFPKS